VKKVSKGHHSSLNELNITPLLDLAFVLLVIFIITTPQLSNDLEMNLPSPRKDRPASPPPRINRITIETDGRIALNNQEMELPVLKRTLVTMKGDEPGVSVVVRGSPEVDYQKVIGVLDTLQQVNITNVGLATVTAQ
jgi:biopolymer transport protein ExbD